MRDPLVSIVMPAYNAMKYLPSAIASVMYQTWENWELCIVDDASADETGAYLDSLQDPRIRVFHNEINRGTAYSRNRGIHEAKGGWIAFLDSDDMWREDKLEKQIAVIENYPDAALVFTGSAFIDDNGNQMKYTLQVPEKISYQDILPQNLISCSSVVVRKELLLKHPFPGAEKVHEDFAIWLQILREIDHAYGVDEPLLIYRLALNSRSRNKLKAARMNWNTYRYAGIGFLQAAASMCGYTIRGLKKYNALRKKV